MAPGITWWVKARLITFLNRHGYRYGKEKHREDEFKGRFNKKEIYSDVSNHINMLFKSICYLGTSFMSQILIFGLHEAKSVLCNNKYCSFFLKI